MLVCICIVTRNFGIFAINPKPRGAKMNEQREIRTKFLTNQMVSDKELDWEGAKARLEMLRTIASMNKRYDLNSVIVRMIIVINKNQPSKKLLKSITKRIYEIEQELANMQIQKTK